jgi:hypothetical protein
MKNIAKIVKNQEIWIQTRKGKIGNCPDAHRDMRWSMSMHVATREGCET